MSPEQPPIVEMRNIQERYGGEGAILGVLIGAALMQTIRTGLNLLGLPTNLQPAAIGAVILLAIMFDQWRKRRIQQT